MRVYYACGDAGLRLSEAKHLHGAGPEAARYGIRRRNHWGSNNPPPGAGTTKLVRCPCDETSARGAEGLHIITGVAESHRGTKRNNPFRGCRALTKPCAYLVTETMLVSFTLLTLGRRLLKCNGSCDMQRLGPENETAPRRGLFDQSDLWSHMQMRWVGVGHGPSDDGGEYTTRYAPVKRNTPRTVRSTRRASGGQKPRLPEVGPEMRSPAG